jgi:hypothetical protein
VNLIDAIIKNNNNEIKGGYVHAAAIMITSQKY